MFGGKGFSNPLGDDILNTFIQDAAKKSQPQKSVPFTDADEKHLLATKKLVQQMADEEESYSKKTPVVKTTSSLAQSNVIKKKPSDKKTNDGVDDLLSFIEDTKNDKPGFKKAPEPKKEIVPIAKTPVNDTPKFTPANRFSEELEDEDLDIPAYDPTVRSSSAKKPGIASEDMAKKKSALFGLSNSALTNMNKSQGSDLQNTQSSHVPVQRPQTMESKPTPVEDEIGEINLGFSRRKGKGTAAKERPATSSSEPKNPEAKTLSVKAESEHPHHEDEGDEESEYLNTILSRDKKDKKPSLGNPPVKLGDTSKSGFGKVGTPLSLMDSSKSPISDFALSKEGFYGSKDSGFPGMEEKKESVKSPVGILGKKELQDPHGQGNAMGKSVASIASQGVRKEKGDRHENLQGSALSGASIEVGNKEVISSAYLKEMEDYYKRRTKETEEYYENRYKRLKEAVEEEKVKWEEIHEKELKLLRKENEDLRENMNKHLERERERMRETVALEIESKEKIHRYELQRQKRMFEEENDSLKKQFDAQMKLNNLADEIKVSSKKLMSMSDKFELEKGTGAKGELRDRERQLEELERRLKMEGERLEEEKRRIERVKMEMENRIGGERESLEKEREMLRNEYARLNTLQESMRKQEYEKSRVLEKERVAYEAERTKLEKGGMALKEEYIRKLRELEVEAEALEMRKREFEKVLERMENKFMQEKIELEKTAKRLAAMEMDMVGRLQELEYKELMVSKGLDEVQKRVDLLELERITFEKERGQVIRIADETRRDNEALRKFRNDFEKEKETNVRLKGDLAVFASNLRKERSKLNQEKNSLNTLQKTLEGLKNDYVKEIDWGYQKPTERTIGTGYPIERSQGSPVGRDSYEYRSPKWEQEKEDVESVGPMQNKVVIPLNSERFVRLKDLKKGGASEREKPKNTSDVTEKRIRDQIRELEEARRLADQKKWKENEKEKEKENRKERKIEDPNEWMKNMSPGHTFNFRNYMSELKEMDKVTNANQGYVMTEEEDLKKRKIEMSLKSPQRTEFNTDNSRYRTTNY